MWVKVASIVGACALGAGSVIGGAVITPPSLMTVALADDSENPVPAPAGRSHSASARVDAEPDGPKPAASHPVPADVIALVLLPGMDPRSLTQNPDGSLVYHGTTPVGVETPGWVAIASPKGGSIEMVRGPVAPAPAAVGPAQSPTAGSFQAEGTAPLPAASTPQPVASAPQPLAAALAQPEVKVPQPAASTPQPVASRTAAAGGCAGAARGEGATAGRIDPAAGSVPTAAAGGCAGAA